MRSETSSMQYLFTSIIAALWALVSMGCTTPTPPRASIPVVQPIPLGEQGSHPLVFLHVVERIPAGTLLGIAHWENSDAPIDEIRSQGNARRDRLFNTAITQLLRQHGYSVLDEADAIFNPGRTLRVRYQLGAVIHEGEVDFVYKKPRVRDDRPPIGEGYAAVVLELQVYDVVERKTVFKQRYRGEGIDSGTEPQPWVLAAVDAVRHALADPQFVAVVSDQEVVDSGKLESKEVVRVPACDQPSTELPEHLDEMMESVVIVKIGNSLGSGVIVSEKGHILSAEHVVGDLGDPIVRLRNGMELPAEIVARSSSRDLVLLKMPGRGYRCSQVARASSEISVGTDLYTFNVVVDESKPVVSRGVLSGYVKDHRDGHRYLQTDATLNPGSSGGPVFDSEGQAVGIVVEKLVGKGYEGLGLAVPSDDVDEALSIQWDE